MVGDGSPFPPPPALRKWGDGLALRDWPIAGMIVVAFVKKVLGLGMNGVNRSASHKFCTVVGWIPRDSILLEARISCVHVTIQLLQNEVRRIGTRTPQASDGHWARSTWSNERMSNLREPFMEYILEVEGSRRLET